MVELIPRQKKLIQRGTGKASLNAKMCLKSCNFFAVILGKYPVTGMK